MLPFMHAEMVSPEVITMTTTVTVIPALEGTPSPINGPPLGTWLQYHNLTDPPAPSVKRGR